MQDSTYRTFTVCLKPAFLLYDGLRVMKQMASSAVLSVQPGYVEIKAISEDPKANAALVMEDLSRSSLGSCLSLDSIHLHLLVWVELLANAQNSDQTIWIYMNGDRHNLYCSIGNDSTPIKLGEANFVQSGSINLVPFGSRYIPRGYVSPILVDLDCRHIWGLRDDDPRCFALSLRTECLRKVISACASNYDHVMMIVFPDTVVFLTVSHTLLFHAQDDDCFIGGEEVGEGQCSLVEWHGEMALRKASKITSHVLICPLVDQDQTRVAAIQFNFEVDELNLLSFVMQAPADS